MNILFLCSRNQWRSPTAEKIFQKRSNINVKSAGTEPGARIKINAKQILWADLIFVMEKKHKQRIQMKYPLETRHKEIHILDIPDEYQFMDPELIEEIKTKVSPYIDF